MAKKSAIERNKKRKRMTDRYAEKRARLKRIIHDRSTPGTARFQASLVLAKMPRNSSPTRIRNRCALTGRPRGYYRKVDMSRIELRALASQGFIPGMIKASW